MTRRELLATAAAPVAAPALEASEDTRPVVGPHVEFIFIDVGKWGEKVEFKRYPSLRHAPTAAELDAYAAGTEIIGRGFECIYEKGQWPVIIDNAKANFERDGYSVSFAGGPA